VKITFTLGEFAGDRVGVCKMVYAISAALQNNFLIALKAAEWAVGFLLKICSDGLAVGSSLCRKHFAVVGGEDANPLSQQSYQT
jgi:hypothetical protein